MQVQRPRPTSHLARSSASQALAQQLPRLPTPRISDKSGEFCHVIFATKILMFESCPNGWIPPRCPWRLSTAQPSLLQGPHARATLEWLNTQAMAVLFYSIKISKLCRSSPNLTSKVLKLRLILLQNILYSSTSVIFRSQPQNQNPQLPLPFFVGWPGPTSLHSAA